MGGGLGDVVSDGIMGAFYEAKALLGADDPELQSSNVGEQSTLLGRTASGIQHIASKTGGRFADKVGGQWGTAYQVAAIGRDRWTGFFVLLGCGCLLMLMASMSIPLIILMPV